MFIISSRKLYFLLLPDRNMLNMFIPDRGSNLCSGCPQVPGVQPESQKKTNNNTEFNLRRSTCFVTLSQRCLRRQKPPALAQTLSTFLTRDSSAFTWWMSALVRNEGYIHLSAALISDHNYWQPGKEQLMYTEFVQRVTRAARCEAALLTCMLRETKSHIQEAENTHFNTNIWLKHMKL